MTLIGFVILDFVQSEAGQQTMTLLKNALLRLDQKENQKPSQKKDFSLIRLKGIGSPEAKNQKNKIKPRRTRRLKYKI
jgi:hypothetical protein